MKAETVWSMGRTRANQDGKTRSSTRSRSRWITSNPMMTTMRIDFVSFFGCRCLF